MFFFFLFILFLCDTYKEHLPFFCCDSYHLPVVFNNALPVLPYLHIYQSQDSDWAVGCMAEES